MQDVLSKFGSFLLPFPGLSAKLTANGSMDICRDNFIRAQGYLRNHLVKQTMVGPESPPRYLDK